MGEKYESLSENKVLCTEFGIKNFQEAVSEIVTCTNI
jgi:hypothetical protein